MSVCIRGRDTCYVQHWLGGPQVRTRRAARPRARTRPQRACRLGYTWYARRTRRSGRVGAVRARSGTQTRAYNTDITLVAEWQRASKQRVPPWHAAPRVVLSHPTGACTRGAFGGRWWRGARAPRLCRSMVCLSKPKLRRETSTASSRAPASARGRASRRDARRAARRAGVMPSARHRASRAKPHGSANTRRRADAVGRCGDVCARARAPQRAVRGSRRLVSASATL